MIWSFLPRTLDIGSDDADVDEGCLEVEAELFVNSGLG